MFPPLESSLFALAIVAVLAYLIGSIPFGLIITRIFGLGDIRKIGSGNIGATNVLRTGSKTAALATVLLDAGKGLVPVLAARAAVGEDAAQLAGLSAFLGHLYPVWLNFKGGKGVATVLGVLVALAPFAGLTALLTWLFTFFIFRISSLSALVATIFTPIVLLIVDLRSMLGVVLIMAVFIFWKHRENMKRIYLGDEPMSVWGKSGN